MPEYRYIGVDLLTRQVIEDLPLYGVSLSRQISGAGNFTGSFKLGTGDFSDEDLLNASVPGLRAVYVLRNTQCIWAGPIWSRTYQSQAQVISMTGQTYESIFAKLKVEDLFVLEQVDQIQIFRDLIARMQGQQNCNFGIDYTTYTQMSGVLRDLTIQPYEHKLFSEPLDDMLKQANSFDYIIDYLVNPATDAITLFAKTGYPYLGFGQAGIELDYPGPVSNYYYPESGSRGIVRETILGQGEGTAMAVGTYTNQDLVDAGYPMWQQPRSEKSISDPAQIARIAEESGRTRKMPVSIPTIELEIGDEAVDFSEWSNFGVPINFHVQDARFPDGKDISSRMLGWDYHPLSSDGTENLKIILEGQE